MITHLHSARIRGPEARFLAAGIALLLLLAQVGGLAHLLHVRHQVCSEHGELVHVPATEGERATARPSSDQPSLSAAADASATRHVHGCAVLAHLRSAFRPGSGNAHVAPAQLLACPWCAFDQDVQISSLAVLHYAPKNSPPAVEPA